MCGSKRPDRLPFRFSHLLMKIYFERRTISRIPAGCDWGVGRRWGGGVRGRGASGPRDAHPRNASKTSVFTVQYTSLDLQTQLDPWAPVGGLPYALKPKSPRSMCRYLFVCMNASTSTLQPRPRQLVFPAGAPQPQLQIS